MEFPLKVLNLTRVRGINQQELARRAGVGEATVSRWLNGQSKPFLAHGLILSRIFGVPLEWLADDSKPWPPPNDNVGLGGHDITPISPGGSDAGGDQKSVAKPPADAPRRIGRKRRG